MKDIDDTVRQGLILAADIFLLMEGRAPTNVDGTIAIICALIISMKAADDDDKQAALEAVSDIWDQMEPVIQRLGLEEVQ